MCVAEAPCSEPAKNVTLVFSRSDHLAGRVVTDGQGRYRLRLPPGLYSVRRAASAGLDNRLDPNRVRVSARRLIHVDFSIDTGIR
jgi:protocatechuate 3,4-dioxygenase beta subunit